MLHLARENNVDVLRQAAMILDQENRKLIERNLALTREILSLKGEPQMDLAMKLEDLEQQLARRNQKLFGDSSEKRPRAAKDDEEQEPKRGHGPREQPELPIVDEIHKLDVPDQTCPQCGGQLQEWAGQFEESFETDVLERRFFRRKHKRQKYRCACQSCVETAPGPAKLTKGGQYSVELAVQVAVSKYLDHVPLERQVSTPFGKRGHFHSEWESGGDGWKRVKITAEECPRIDPEFLKTERQSLGDAWYFQECGCRFLQTDGQLISEESIQAAFSQEIKQDDLGDVKWN